MKTKFVLNLDSISDLNNFVKEISSEIESDVDAVYERQIVDAKSFLGLVTISIHPITVVLNSESEREIRLFSDICMKYELQEGR